MDTPYVFLDPEQNRYWAWERFSRICWLGRLTLAPPGLCTITFQGRSWLAARTDG